MIASICSLVVPADTRTLAAATCARRKFKHRSRTTRDPPPRFYPLRATPSTRPQPPARTDPRPHAAAFPPREHTAPAPRPASYTYFDNVVFANSGQCTFSFVVPPAPQLLGVPLYLQGLLEQSRAPARFTSYFRVVVQ